MWTKKYWPGKYWTGKYWPPAEQDAAASEQCGSCGLYGDGSLYGDGELYCSNEFVRESFLVVKDVLAHYVSVRIQATGRFILDSIRGLVKRRTIQAFNYYVDVDKNDIKRLSFRVQGSGCLRLTSVRPQIKIRNQQPVQ